MAKAIFTTKVSPTYDDLPEDRYHFPSTYLNQVRSAVGDHIIYYEPRRTTAKDSSRGGRQAYFAVARVDRVIPDPARSDHFYAQITRGSYLDFDRPVQFAEGEHYYESGLRRSDGKTSKGAFGRAVRILPDAEFEQILQAGFGREIEARTGGFEQQAAPEFEPIGPETARPLVQLTISRPFRDRAFQRAVRSAYDNRCAMTGLRLINGGGRPEVQASHIMPVASNGPDAVRNGLALSGTMHWLFDRGLISVSEGYEILISKNSVPDPVVRILNRDLKLLVPKDPTSRPHPHYLKFHREYVFKG